MISWHWNRWRCRVGDAFYRISARIAFVADRIDPPADHRARMAGLWRETVVTTDRGALTSADALIRRLGGR